MPDTAREMPHLVAQKLTEIHVFGYEYRPFNGAVQTGSLRLVEARTAPRLMIREREKAGEKEN